MKNNQPPENKDLQPKRRLLGIVIVLLLFMSSITRWISVPPGETSSWIVLLGCILCILAFSLYTYWVWKNKRRSPFSWFLVVAGWALSIDGMFMYGIPNVVQILRIHNLIR
jgi:hypothetical protein